MNPATVIIPCWRRPEFLAACLHYIQKADDWEENLYYFSIDHKPGVGKAMDPEVLEVIKSFPGQYKYKVKTNSSHGNSLNVLSSYREVSEWQKEGLIYLIETDIFIAKDFFTWHKATHEATNEFFVSACRNQNFKGAQNLPNEAGSVYSFPKYQSLGNSFKPMQLAHILPHITPKYYGKMTVNPALDHSRSLGTMLSYCMRAFPGSKFGRMWCEQDGLINRIMEAKGLKGIFPYIPRAYHAGFGGYNRPASMLPKTMNLEKRKKALLNMSEEEMNGRAKTMPDITKCDLNGCEPNPIKLVPPDAIPTR